MGRSDHVISQPQDSHCIVLRSKPISFRNSMAIAWSLNRLQKSNLFGPPSALTIRHPYENLGTFCIHRTCSLYWVRTLEICTTNVVTEMENGTKKQEGRTETGETLSPQVHYFSVQAATGQQDACCIVGVAACIVVHCGCFMKKAETWVNGIRKTYSKYCSDTHVGERKIGVPILQWFHDLLQTAQQYGCSTLCKH